MVFPAAMLQFKTAQRPTASCADHFLGSSFQLSSRKTLRRTARATFIVKAADSAKVLEEVRSVIAEQLGTDLNEVKPDSNFVDLGADSLDTVEIMMALEEKFDLELEEEGVEKIGTVQEAADMIAAQIS